MPKLLRKEVTKQDIETYLSGEADFAFEMRVLSVLGTLKFTSKHGGSYTDPLQNKARQFDIRSQRRYEKQTLKLAVECKNIKRSSPLVIHCVPRRREEAFHQLLVLRSNAVPRLPVAGPDPHTVPASLSRYQPGDLVGKAADQIRIASDGRPESHESEVFDKISQSINSCYDLIRESALMSSGEFAHAILPILVVPDGVLWSVTYEDSGNRSTPVAQVESLDFFIDRSWQLSEVPGFVFRLSHLEIVTLSGLKNRFGPGVMLDGDIFPRTLWLQ